MPRVQATERVPPLFWASKKFKGDGEMQAGETMASPIHTLN